jgi:hypothetical protein
VLEQLDRSKACPICRDPLTKNKLLPNVLICSMINDSEVKCFSSEYSKEGELTLCIWFGKLNEREAHYNRCPFALSKCPHSNCDKEILRKDLPGHIVDCIHRVVPCKWCDMKWKVDRIIAHQSVCLMRPTPCPNRCVDANRELSLFLPRQIAEHCTTCALESVGCMYARDAGCKVVLHRKDMPSHERDAAAHIECFTAKVYADRNKISDLERVVKELSRQARVTNL